VQDSVFAGTRPGTTGASMLNNKSMSDARFAGNEQPSVPTTNWGL